MRFLTVGLHDGGAGSGVGVVGRHVEARRDDVGNIPRSWDEWGPHQARPRSPIPVSMLRIPPGSYGNRANRPVPPIDPPKLEFPSEPAGVHEAVYDPKLLVLDADYWMRLCPLTWDRVFLSAG